MPKTPYTEHLPIFKAQKHGICPYCHTFITKGSIIVKLATPEEPWTDDGITCSRTGGVYHYDGKRISRAPRDYAHWSCYKEILIYGSDGCWYCQSEDDLTIDHIKPTSLGGPDTPGNITVACRSCNSSKGTRNYDDFIKTLPDQHQQRIYNQ